jgi:hypothetical protein
MADDRRNNLKGMVSNIGTKKLQRELKEQVRKENKEKKNPAESED